MFGSQSIITLPKASEAWQIMGTDTALFGQTIAVLVISIIAVLICFIHRTGVVFNTAR